MSDEDSDSEARGVDALRLLKQGGIISPKTGEASVGTSSAQPATSVPLVPLFASQKRSRSLSQDLNEQNQPSTSQKVEVSPPSTIRAGSQGGERQDRNIKQHSSAPERCFNLSKELRSSKSAPDLTLPALAAIRGLQNGTLQVDRHTRMKIAAAAKRVLEARELKRRSSQEREPQIVYPYPAPDPVSPLALQSQVLWDSPSQNATLATPLPPEPRTGGRGASLNEVGQLAEAPGSLGTAAAIAKGQSPAGTAKGNFHRPALGVVSQGGALLSTSHPPFTVTTGLPRFYAGDTNQGNEEQSLSVMSTTPLDAAPEGGNITKLSDSKVLDATDLFQSQIDSSRQ